MEEVALRGRRPAKGGRPKPVIGGYFDNSDSDESADEPYTDPIASPNIPGTPNLTITYPRQKDIRKEGYLFKQGGVDRNQGWKKRWFIFDAKALKYYLNQKSSVSLRIIPVALMRSVSPVNERRPLSRSSATDLFSVPSRQYQFTFECKQRTFLFGTDTMDNCQQWQNSLMAAIIENHKLGSTDALHGGEMNCPDISGSVRFDKNRKQYFIALKGELLRYYYNEEDFAIDSPIHELCMKITSVKEINKTSLQLDSPPNQRFVLHFELECETIQWKIFIETAIARALGDNTIVDKVRDAADENAVCADCSSTDADWASINLGITLCPKCAGAHRGMGVRRSKVRSLRMDNIFHQNENVLQLLTHIGNKTANEFWYKHRVDARVIDRQTPDIIRRKHIEEKYIKKAFCNIPKFDNNEDVNKELFSAVTDGNVVSTMAALFSGADIHFKHQDRTVLEIARETNNDVLKEFLEQNKGTDVSVVPSDDLNGKVITASDKKSSFYHEGYLEKTGPSLKGFVKRWCVLHYGMITYFDDKRGLIQKGSLELSDVTSISVVPGQRENSFDINTQTKHRVYRFAAIDNPCLQTWLTAVIQVISPCDYSGVTNCLMAAHFYFKTHQTCWSKIWLILTDNALIVRHSDKSMADTIDLSKPMPCMQCNIGKHTDKADSDNKQLNDNHRIELIRPDTDAVVCLQGMQLKDTKKLFSLLEIILCS